MSDIGDQYTSTKLLDIGNGHKRGAVLKVLIQTGQVGLLRVIRAANLKLEANHSFKAKWKVSFHLRIARHSIFMAQIA